MAANRIFYAGTQVSIAKQSTNVFLALHGGQSCSVSTSFNLDKVFELGQISLYELSEQIPDVTVNISKVLDGYPLAYHLLTNGATSATLSGRAVKAGQVGISYFNDAQDAASGTPMSELVMSGLFCNSIEYDFPVQGPFTETVGAVGFNKKWKYSSFIISGAFNNTDSPSGYVQRRQHFLFNYPTGITTADVNGASNTSVACILPQDVDGISSSGTNNRDSGGNFAAHVQRVRVSTNLNREAIYELGRKAPYFRYVNFPVEVNCEIETIAVRGDSVSATENGENADGTNLSNRTIKIKTTDGTLLDLGIKNKLQSVNQTGGDTGGGNVTVTYSYQNYNDLTVTHPADPSGL
jgi:hypothetical protein